jgi:homoserine dehydrogenase
MRRVRLALIGFGGVGRAFADVLELRAPGLRSSHDLDIKIVAVRRSDLQTAIRPGAPVDTWHWVPTRGVSAFVAEAASDIVVQAVPSSPDSVKDALDQALASLEAGAHLVTATKSHLVAHWSRLEAASLAASRAVRMSAAAGATLPAVDLARRGVRGLGCIRIRGSLNGTSNAVVESLAAGMSLEDAIAQAQAAGIAEPDPSSDLSGKDAAAKLVILANLAWGGMHNLASVATEPIDADTAVRAIQATADGRALRSVATAMAHGDAIGVRLEAVDRDDPLYRLPGAEKAVEFDCGLAGSIVVTGGRSSPRSAGLAMLKDVVNLLTGDDSPGLR